MSKTAPKILAWINCYGGWTPELRHPVETIGYDQYLESIANALAALEGRIEAVYVSGGMRDPAGRTECETTIPEISRRLQRRGVSGLSMNADEQSLTSITIARKFLELWQAKYAGCIPLLFCDQARYETNAYVLKQFAETSRRDLPPIHEVLIPIPRLDNHPNSTPEKQAEKLRHLKEKGIEAVEKLEIEARR
ncbi:MAG TPA: hypothetical protein VMT30_04810 [Candidatus Saccharimonadia bacterium]|nr:hypothetical protein [Candidatus Saccharimonadia bacterium]